MTATQPSPAMPERWTELIASRKQKQLCTEEIKTIRLSCESEHGKEHISECSACYDKVLDRIRSRYTNSNEREWFKERRAFIQELEDMLSEVKQRKKSLKFVEARIEEEKEAWYRWMLRSHPDFLAVADHGAHQNDLRGMLDDPDRSREDLVKRMWEGVGTSDDWSSRVDRFTEEVMAADGKQEALKGLYVPYFFIDSSTGEPLPHSDKYLAKYRDDDKVSLEEVIDMIAQDSQLSRSSQPQRDNHKNRLDELRRARTAFEHNRAQAKSRAHGGQAGDELYELPPCSVCQKPVDPKAVLSCAICQAVTQMGGEKKLTVYCTEECYRKGHDQHAEKDHDCEAGDSCVQLYDEDVDMDDGTSKVVACRECLDQKQVTIYCSGKCAGENLSRHRQVKHGVKTAADEVQSLIIPLDEAVGSVLETRNPGLKMAPVDL